MRRLNAVFEERPEKTSVSITDGVAHVTLADNIREKSGDEQTIYIADLYFMAIPATGDIIERVNTNFDGFLEKAKAQTAEEEKSAQEKSAALNATEIATILADQEFRILMLESAGV